MTQSHTIHNQTIGVLLQQMLGTYQPAVGKAKYCCKLDWEARQLEADDSKKRYQALVAQRRGTCFSFWMEKYVCVKDRDDDSINFFPVIIFLWASTEMKQKTRPF